MGSGLPGVPCRVMMSRSCRAVVLSSSVLERCSDQSRTTQVGLEQACVVELCIGEAGPRQIRPIQDRSRELRIVTSHLNIWIMTIKPDVVRVSSYPASRTGLVDKQNGPEFGSLPAPQHEQVTAAVLRQFDGLSRGTCELGPSRHRTRPKSRCLGLQADYMFLEGQHVTRPRSGSAPSPKHPT